MRARHLARKIVEKLREGPAGLLAYGVPLLRGTYCILYYRLFRRNVRIRWPFYVHDRVHITGPGSVLIDWGCHVRALSFDRLTITTLSPEATVVIGSRCNFGALIIRCSRNITIGAEVMSANCLIQDAPFFSSPEAVTEASIASANIEIGDGVWMSDLTMILAGSKIGAHSVLSRGTVCWDYHVPANRVVFGNPVLGVLDILRLDTLMRHG